MSSEWVNGYSENRNWRKLLTSIPCPDGEESGKIIQVMGEGYKLNNKVLRAAKVIVYEGWIYCLKCI